MRFLTTIAFAFVLATGLASGWSSPKLANVVNTAPQPNGSVTVHADVLGPFDWTDMMTARLYYSTNNQSSWTEVTMSPEPRPGYDSTFAASFPVGASGNVYYYVKAKDTFGYATQSPINSANTWPPPLNLLTEVADEGRGDMVNSPDGPFLDLTSIRMGYSATHFYARLTNDDDEWPRSKLWPPTWYLYSAGFRNPDAPQDTWVYVMAYGNILAQYTPGVYVLNSYTLDFEQIGDIDDRTNGNVLEMRCLISDMTSHHGFGPWPNTSGYLRAARGDTRSVDINRNSETHDTTNQSRWYVDRTPRFPIGFNTAPMLSREQVVPPSGTPETEFWFNVRYTDADSNLPQLCAVLIDNDTFELVPGSHRYWAGVTFDTTLTGFDPGWHDVHFYAHDGMSQVLSDPDSFYVAGVAVAERPAFDLDGRALLAVPNPFRNEVNLAVDTWDAELEISSSTGRLMRRLRARGGRARWDGRDESGRLLPAGVYFCRIAGRIRDRLRLIRLGR